MKAKFFNWYNALAASLLSLLGFHLVERTDRGVMNLCSMVLHLQPSRRKEILRQRMVLL